jgi:hypothetical protein
MISYYILLPVCRLWPCYTTMEWSVCNLTICRPHRSCTSRFIQPWRKMFGKWFRGHHCSVLGPQHTDPNVHMQRWMLRIHLFVSFVAMLLIAWIVVLLKQCRFYSLNMVIIVHAKCVFIKVSYFLWLHQRYLITFMGKWGWRHSSHPYIGFLHNHAGQSNLFIKANL